MAAIPPQATGQLGVFTAAQALDAGWSRASLTRACASGRLRRVRAGAYCVTDRSRDRRLGEHQLARLECQQAGVAAALKITGSVISHQTAAVILGLPLLGRPTDRPCLTVSPDRRVAEAGAHVHRCRVGPDQVLRLGRLRLTDGTRTCLDLAREFGLAHGLVAADHALRKGISTREQLQAGYRLMRGRGGSPAARQLAGLADGRHESPLETLSGLALNRLPEQPAPQVSLFSAIHGFLARVDFYWERLGVVGEADGRLKYSEDELWREKLREDRLAEHGLVIVRWGWADVVRPELLRAKVGRKLHQAEGLRAAGYPLSVIRA